MDLPLIALHSHNEKIYKKHQEEEGLFIVFLSFFNDNRET